MITTPELELRTNDAVPIVVSLDAAHSMIALPAKPPVLHAMGVHAVTRTDGVPRESPPYEEWGFAERAWYLEKRQGFTGVIRALLWPTEGVVEVGTHDSIWAERTQKPPVEFFRFQISEAGYQSLRCYLRETIASEEPVGIVGNSRFCVARSSYHLFHHCHHYTAKGLREAGLPISMWGALTRNGFARQLRRIAPLS
ncbi:MAG: DUF2459 domain-containing protein [Nitrospiraceae bacterium]|jgi:hypothetical protein|nr:DUF2459 domain-containing protein [Nitrospiraceae bacterium]